MGNKNRDARKRDEKAKSATAKAQRMRSPAGDSGYAKKKRRRDSGQEPNWAYDEPVNTAAPAPLSHYRPGSIASPMLLAGKSSSSSTYRPPWKKYRYIL